MSSLDSIYDIPSTHTHTQKHSQFTTHADTATSNIPPCFSYINTFFAYLYRRQWVLRELLRQVLSSFLWNHLTCPASNSHCYHLECEVNFMISLVFCLSQNVWFLHFSEVQEFRHNVLIWEVIFVCQQWKMRYKTTWNERSALPKSFLKYLPQKFVWQEFLAMTYALE